MCINQVTYAKCERCKELEKIAEDKIRCDEAIEKKLDDCGNIRYRIVEIRKYWYNCLKCMEEYEKKLETLT